MEEKILVRAQDGVRIWLEDQEICREYFKTDKITCL